MSLDPSIFKAYDIRGIVPSQLDKAGATAIGKAFAQLIKTETKKDHPNVIVSGDMRLTTPKLKKALITGIIDQGVNVTDIGLASTPTFYFAVAEYHHDGGIQVSASHNPKEYNGFKMTRQRAVPISGEDGIDQIKTWAVTNNFESAKTPGKIALKKQVLSEQYSAQVAELKLDPKKIKPFKIVIDAANAMGALDMETTFQATKCQIIKLNYDLDGNFPAHQADPLDEKNMRQLQQAVIDHQADLGIAPDGDSDRIFFVDDKGKTFDQSILRGIMSQIALKRNPGSVICYDIRPGKVTKDMIEEAGGKPSVTRVGHSLIKAQMLQEGAVFGGESSGHYFYQFQNGSYEAPIPLIIDFLTYLTEQNQSLSKIAQNLARYYHSGEINSEVKDVVKVLERVKNQFADAEISTLDGVTVTYPDYWFNVRGSNTEPKIRLNLEATNHELMEEKRDEVLQIIRKV